MLKNARRGSGSNVDFFVGDDHVINSAVLLENVKRHRLACTPSSASVQVLEDTPRSVILPNKTAKQQFAVKSLTVQVGRTQRRRTDGTQCYAAVGHQHAPAERPIA